MTYGHLRADCVYTRISSGPNTRYRLWESLYLFVSVIHFQWHICALLNLQVSFSETCDRVLDCYPVVSHQYVQTVGEGRVGVSCVTKLSKLPIDLFFLIHLQCLDNVCWASEQNPACKTNEQVLACLSVDLTQSRVTAAI